MPKVDLRGLELTTMHTAGQGRVYRPDCEVLASECPSRFDTRTLETIGRIMGWPESRIDAAIVDGLRSGYFRPD